MLFLEFNYRIYNVKKGTYALVMELGSETTIAVGRLGRRSGEREITFPAGCYVYFGSAHGGLRGRVSRHLKREGAKGSGGSRKKRFHWHIDYLVQFADVTQVWYALEEEQGEWLLRKEKLECLWCQAARELPQAQFLIPGFGSSDCRCPSHLIYFPAPPSFELFLQLLEERGYEVIKSSPHDFMLHMED